MNDKLELIIESALMRSSEPLSIQSLMNLFDTYSAILSIRVSMPLPFETEILIQPSCL